MRNSSVVPLVSFTCFSQRHAHKFRAFFAAPGRIFFFPSAFAANLLLDALGPSSFVFLIGLSAGAGTVLAIPLGPKISASGSCNIISFSLSAHSSCMF
ncbi:hypothetical protein BDR07DRAFT_1400773 [Suillus spraguei]|nr:hypothetical protein BDR07DRAFT_1445715 [Suillus spraguei]KAG2353148.1 hypothetical protein BDR07DRAFT_1434301 [Suillus spraguei]KAG2362290.1 hypothetical protein BDR07DRAFT_1407495 [Suillus spraguei]KAG2364826.1 hypothetical protein BDR07DRAFT_1400773 [Suillus spraguei]